MVDDAYGCDGVPVDRAREQVLRHVARCVPEAPTGWVRVAVDGVDGAGKTTFADELAEVLAAAARVTIRASVDGFHHCRARRYRRGRRGWEGFWLDAFDVEQLRSELLDPLQPGGSGRYRQAVQDLARDQSLALPYDLAPLTAVLLLDGVFLHRDELVDCWDLSIFLEVPFEISVARMAARDGGDPDPDAPSVRRYVQAQRHYLEAASPRARATIVIDNSDIEQPVLIH